MLMFLTSVQFNGFVQTLHIIIEKKKKECWPPVAHSNKQMRKSLGRDLQETVMLVLLSWKDERETAVRMLSKSTVL